MLVVDPMSTSPQGSTSGSPCCASPTLSPRAICSQRPRSPLLTKLKAGARAMESPRPVDVVVDMHGSTGAIAVDEMPSLDSLTTCAICEDEDATVRISCGKHRFCETCMETYVEDRMFSGNITVTCPSCDHELSTDELVRFFAPKRAARLHRLRLQNFLMRDPDIRWCPQPNCGWAVSIDFTKSTFGTDCTHGGPAHRITCGKCEKDFCTVCRQAWHEGSNCAPTILRVSDDLGLEYEYKPCPSCFMLVYKETGCNVVRCRCGVEFCWLCLKPCQEATHFLPHKPCRLFTNKTSKPAVCWKQYGLLVIFSPLLAIPAALIGAGVGIAMAREAILEGLKHVKGKRKRKAVVAASVGTSPIWLVGSGVMGATFILVCGATYLVCFPGLFVKERVKAKRKEKQALLEAGEAEAEVVERPEFESILA